MKTKEEYIQIATQYAFEKGKDTVRIAGERNGYKYFHIFCWETRNHKLGIFQYIKISPEGKVSKVVDFQEIQWAGHQEIILNNLSTIS